MSPIQIKPNESIITEFPWLVVTKEGNIINYKGKVPRVLKGHKDKNGYMSFNTRKRPEKAKTFIIHRLVALAFIPNPENKEFVDHKDGNRSNNNIGNLKWVTQKENMNTEQYKKTNSNRHAKRKWMKGLTYWELELAASGDLSIGERV